MPLFDDYALFKNFESFPKFLKEHGEKKFKIFLLTNTTRSDCDATEKIFKKLSMDLNYCELDFYIVDKSQDVSGYFMTSLSEQIKILRFS